MNTSEIIRQFGVEHIGRFYSTYRGVVMDDQDPSSTGKLQILIPSIYNGITVWARSKSFYGGPKIGFKYLTPKKGEIVFVEFESGDPLKALWSYHHWAEFEMPEELDNDTIGFITPNGNKVLLKEKDGTLYIETKGDVDIVSDGVITKKGEEIHLQEGKVGIPQSTDVVQRLNLIEKKLNLYIKAMKSAPAITASDQGSAFKFHMVTQVSDELVLTEIDDIASKTIKQPK